MDYVPLIAKYTLVIVGAVASLALGALYLFQCDLIYPSSYPEGSREKVASPEEYNLPFDNLRLRTPDGVRIHGFLIKRPTDEETRRAPTVLYFHANAGNMGHRLPIAKVLYERLKCNVLMISYRGYGLSEGQANERGIQTDATTALHFIRDHPLLAKTRVVAYGQSIGGAVAIDLVAREEDQFAGLIIENTFRSLRQLIPTVLPWFRYAAAFCHQRWNSEVAVARLRRTPILFLSGGQDDLVPPAHMKVLYDEVPEGVPKVWHAFPAGKHNDTCIQDGYFEAIEAFWQTYVLKAQG
ncbi:bem46 protein, variant [Tieghemiomyces parasiticus]|uniref:Bem46 protein, variant n=1 Tax=Tieghemiomyces parasiticus TaxID=78921 RepID=A0A9W8A998_9FUNG|nr:bem46 protein, variant [Tieghemiomyces parasiticus]